MATITRTPCDCGGTIGVTARGKRLDIHRSQTCPAIPPRLAPPARWPRDNYDVHAALRRAFVALKADLHAAHGKLDSPSTRDWPPDAPVPTAELTLESQLWLLLKRVTALVQHGHFAAEPLRRRVTRLLGADGFTAPATLEVAEEDVPQLLVIPPRAVDLAIKRLGPVTPCGATLVTAQVHDSPSTARDRRLLEWWLSTREG